MESIPFEIANEERIVRVLFYPKNFNTKGMRWQAYKTPAKIDEVSTVRVDFCGESWCKKYGKSIANPNDPKSNYYGFGVHKAQEIRAKGCEVIYTPEHHEYHSDIKIGFIPEVGKALPPEIQFKVEELSLAARVYKDTEPDAENWQQDPVK